MKIPTITKVLLLIRKLLIVLFFIGFMILLIMYPMSDRKFLKQTRFMIISSDSTELYKLRSDAPIPSDTIKGYLDKGDSVEHYFSSDEKPFPAFHVVKTETRQYGWVHKKDLKEAACPYIYIFNDNRTTYFNKYKDVSFKIRREKFWPASLIIFIILYLYIVYDVYRDKRTRGEAIIYSMMAVPVYFFILVYPGIWDLYIRSFSVLMKGILVVVVAVAGLFSIWLFVRILDIITNNRPRTDIYWRTYKK